MKSHILLALSLAAGIASSHPVNHGPNRAAKNAVDVKRAVPADPTGTRLANGHQVLSKRQWPDDYIPHPDADAAVDGDGPKNDGEYDIDGGIRSELDVDGPGEYGDIDGGIRSEPDVAPEAEATAYAEHAGLPLAKRLELDYTPETEEEAAELAEAVAQADDGHDDDTDVTPKFDYDQAIDVDIKPEYDNDIVDVDVDVDVDGTDNNEKYEEELEGGIRSQLEAAALAGAY